MKGVVTLRGKPAAGGGEITFNPSNVDRKGPSVVGKIADDGSFSLSSIRGGNVVKSSPAHSSKDEPGVALTSRFVELSRARASSTSACLVPTTSQEAPSTPRTRNPARLGENNSDRSRTRSPEACLVWLRATPRSEYPSRRFGDGTPGPRQSDPHMLPKTAAGITQILQFSSITKSIVYGDHRLKSCGVQIACLAQSGFVAVEKPFSANGGIRVASNQNITSSKIWFPLSRGEAVPWEFGGPKSAFRLTLPRSLRPRYPDPSLGRWAKPK